jgi:hypothetical protein
MPLNLLRAGYSLVRAQPHPETLSIMVGGRMMRSNTPDSCSMCSA